MCLRKIWFLGGNKFPHTQLMSYSTSSGVSTDGGGDKGVDNIGEGGDRLALVIL
jgi:hypothetical protein